MHTFRSVPGRRFATAVSLASSLGFAIAAAVPVAAQDSVAVHPLPSLDTAEDVTIWKRNACGADHLPDSPARALRLADGRVALIAAHYENRVLIGPDFDALKARCDIVAAGAENSDPSAVDDRYWIQAWMPMSGGRVLALVSHEFMGRRHPGVCRVPQVGYYPTCWYSTIAIAQGTLDPFRLELAPSRTRIMAASPKAFDPTIKERSGFFTVSNIVREGRYAFVFSYMEFPDRRGNCLFRALADRPESGWQARADGKFDRRMTGAYGGGDIARQRCDIIGANVFSGPLRSVVWVERMQRWMAVFAANAKPGPRQADESGVFYSLSSNLIDWTPRRRLVASRQPWGQQDCALFYEYPSLIDHDSSSDIFDRVEGGSVHLYLTRFNFASCKKGLDRDLVRLKIDLDRLP